MEEPEEPLFIVEGWIETDRPAVVILTQMLHFTDEGRDKEYNLKDIPLRWATVKLSDGEREETLVGTLDKNYTPSYVYVGSSILGEPGKTYRLSVSYFGASLWAESTMPEEVRIDRAEAHLNASDPEQFSVKLYFEDDRETKDYYKVFTKVKDKDRRWYASFMNNIDDSVFPDGKGNVVVNNSFRHLGFGKEDFTPYFSVGDVVGVKLARLPREGYEFWYSYENEITNKGNVLFPTDTDVKTNIHGGRGIWCAYAVDIVDVEMP